MEREYVVSAIIVLVVIVVIGLAVWAFFPGFTDDVKRIADEVFGFTEAKGKKITAEIEEDKAIEMLEVIANAYRNALEGETCTVNFELNPVLKKYRIRKVEQIFKLMDAKINMPIKDSGDLGEFNFCYMEDVKTVKELSELEFYYDEEWRIRIDGEEHRFHANSPKLYRTGDNVCLITDKVDATAFKRIKDCITGEKVAKENAELFFKDFIRKYKSCEDKELCSCGSMDFSKLEGYYIKAEPLEKDVIFKLFDYNNKLISEKNVSSARIGFLKARVGALFEWMVEESYEKDVFDRETRIPAEEYYIVFIGKEYGVVNRLLSEEGKLRTCFGQAEAGFQEELAKRYYQGRLHLKDPKGDEYFETIYRSAERYDVDFFLVVSIIKQESNWNPKAVSNVGAAGLMQFMPCTARDMDLEVPRKSYTLNEDGACKKNTEYKCTSEDDSDCDFKKDERFNPEKAIPAGVRYLDWLRKYLKDNGIEASYENLMAAYNAGPGNVKKYKGIPPFKETQDYVKKVCGFYKDFSTEDVCLLN